MLRTALLLSLVACPLAALAQSDLRVIMHMTNDEIVTVWGDNSGPGVARDVVMLVDIPPALTVRGFWQATNCDTSQRPVRCTAATMTGREGLLLEFNVAAPNADATHTITATITGADADANPADNTAAVTFSTRLRTDFHNHVEPSVARAEPGRTHTFTALLRNVSVAVPTDIRVQFDVTNGTLESIAPPPAFTCTLDATRGVCTATELVPGCLCSGPFAVTVRAQSDRAGGETLLAMSSTSNLPDAYPYAAAATLQSYRMIAVTTTADSGPGSLRAAIDEANASCAPGPCKVVFEIPEPVPAEGWFTLVPETELPAIVTDRVDVDGSTQTRFTGDTNPAGPEIAIDGGLALRGLRVYSPCELVVQGLAIGNFTGGDGLRAGGDRRCGSYVGDRHLVTNNFIGIRPDGTPWPNQRGLHLDTSIMWIEVADNHVRHNLWSGIWAWKGSPQIVRNRIEDNGKSGIFLGPETQSVRIRGNTIARNAEMGVAIAPGSALYDVRHNSMIANGGLGIDIGLDGRSPVDTDDTDAPSNAPVLLGAYYDAARDRTLVTLSLQTTRLGPYLGTVFFEFYVNAGPDGDGERPIMEWPGGYPGDGTPFTVELYGDYRGKWINATSTRTHSWFVRTPGQPRTNFTGDGSWTSELSNAVPVM